MFNTQYYEVVLVHFQEVAKDDKKSCSKYEQFSLNIHFYHLIMNLRKMQYYISLRKGVLMLTKTIHAYINNGEGWVQQRHKWQEEIVCREV